MPARLLAVLACLAALAIAPSSAQAGHSELAVEAAASVDLRINFQPDAAPAPVGYTKDTGLSYDGLRGFGWIRQDSVGSLFPVGLDVSPNARDRNKVADQRLDTFIHMQYPPTINTAGAVKIPAAWEVAVPDGDYVVTVAVGDATETNSVHRINLEGQAAIAGFVPTTANRFATATTNVTVDDGKLTVDAIGGTNTKLTYITIQDTIADTTPPAPPAGVTAAPGDSSVSLHWQPNTESDLAGYNVYRSTTLPVNTAGTPLNGGTPITATAYDDTGLTNGTQYHYVVEAVDTAGNGAPGATVSATPLDSGTGPVDLKVNFQPASAPIPAGYIADSGLAWSAARGFGWFRQDSLSSSHVPLDISGNARDRNKAGDQRLDTFMHMQYPPTINTAGTVNIPAAWETAVPNGSYDVEVSVGDATQVDSTHQINIENQAAISAFQPTTANRFTSATRMVTVSDGRLTIDAVGGVNTKINYVTIKSVTGADRPAVLSSTPANGAADVARDASVTAELHLPNVGAGVDAATLTSSTVRLTRMTDGQVVPAVLNTSGGGDVIVLQPTTLLGASTQYRFEVTSGLKDLSGASFAPWTSTFTTRETAPGGSGSTARFEKVALPTADENMYTGLAMGPDGKLYALSLDGQVVRWPLNADGTTGTPEVITSLQAANGGPRHALGLAFDPASTAANPILWVSHSYFAFSDAPDWTGKITRMSGPNLGTVQDYVTNLPRSIRDHETNQLTFGPDGDLYVSQGSNTATGQTDTVWGQRPEHLLNASILKIDTDSIVPPLNVKTDSGGTYDPFAGLAPVKIFASGVRNAFDLTWHTNGELYVPTNGSAAGGNTPGTPNPLPAACGSRRLDLATNGAYTGPQVPALSSIGTAQSDFLFRVRQGGYYGHPNPTRCEWVLNGGNPTSSADPSQIASYPVGTLPDRNWRGAAFEFGEHFSPNGVIEYRSNTFSGALRNKLLVARYSAGDDIIALTPGGPNQDIVDSTTGIEGFTGLTDPLDLVEDRSNGNIYVTELGASRITLLRPIGDVPQAQDIDAVPGRVIFSDTAGGAASAPKSVRLRNLGGAPLRVDQLELTGIDAGQFRIESPPALPATIAPGDFVDVSVAFNPTSQGVKSAALRVTSDDPDETAIDVRLRGLGISSTDEPSLQRILDTYELPIATGDPDPATSGLGTATPLGEEIPAQRLRKAGSGNVTIEPLAVFGPQGPSGVTATFGWTPAGSTSGGADVFSVPNTSATTLEPATTGSLSFDPGAGLFGLYTRWPFFSNRTVYTEDALNTFSGAIPHHARFYRLEDSSGNPVQNALVVAFEEHTTGFDYQDMVAIVRNVEPASATADGRLTLENLDTAPYADRLVMSRVGSLASPPAGLGVHDRATVRLHNTGGGELRITGLPVTGPFQVENGPSLPATIPSGGSLDVRVRFTAASGPLSAGTLTIESDDPTGGSKLVDLAGHWQSEPGGSEPTVHQLVNTMFGYGTQITNSGQTLDQNGATAGVGEEVLSAYWERANTSQPVRVTGLAAFRRVGESSFIGWHARGSTTVSTVSTQLSSETQTVFPRAQGSDLTAGTFSPSGEFGIRMDSEWSDDTLNDPTADHANGCSGACGHHMRFWPVRDRSGTLVPNAYLIGMDYEGINYDYQDTLYLLENVKPTAVSTPPPPPPPPPSTYSIMHSASSNRSNALTLDGKTVSGNLYAFVRPETGVRRVSFWLDDPAMSGTPRRIEQTAPYDFVGGTSGAATPFDTRTLANGPHTITALVAKTAGGSDVINATFTSSNSLGGEGGATNPFTWTTKTPVPSARYEAQGGALGGRLWVFGGFFTGTQAYTRSDVYDPATNSWQQIADMPEPLTHAGQVTDGQYFYLAGGYRGNHPGPSDASVYRYDTVNDTWATLPSLPSPRGGGALVRLGRKLHFFGGMNESRTADQGTHWELDLDATNPTWITRAPMPNPRNHVGGVAFQGKACAIGGQHLENEVDGNQDDVHCWDPATDTWSALPDLPNPRGHVSASVWASGGRIFVAGGSVNGDLPTREFTMYDPGTNTWVALPGLLAPRKTPVADLISDTIFVSTGDQGGPTATTWSARLAGTWETAAPAPAALGEVAAGIIGNKLYLVGAGNSQTFAYDLSRNTWTPGLASRQFVGDHHAAEVVNGKLYLFGGIGQGQGKVQIYDPVANSWSLGADMPFAAGSSSTSVIGGKVYVAGGIVGSATTNSAAVYNPATNSWSSIAAMPQGRNHAASATDGQKMYVFGGRGPGSGDNNVVANGFDTVQIYDPAANTWQSSASAGSTIAALPQARGGMGKAVFHNGEFYVMGGETLDGPGATTANVYKRVDVYDPAANTWRLGVAMPTARHGIFPLIHAGRIYVPAGGTAAGLSQSSVLEIYNP